MNRCKYDAFLCYSDKDEDIANHIRKELEKRNKCQIFHDMGSIHPGDVITDALNKAIRKSNYMILLVSENWIKKDRLAIYEQYMAQGKCTVNGGGSIILVTLDKKISCEDGNLQCQMLFRIVEPLKYDDTSVFYDTLARKIKGSTSIYCQVHNVVHIFIKYELNQSIQIMFLKRFTYIEKFSICFLHFARSPTCAVWPTGRPGSRDGMELLHWLYSVLET